MMKTRERVKCMIAVGTGKISGCFSSNMKPRVIEWDSMGALKHFCIMMHYTI